MLISKQRLQWSTQMQTSKEKDKKYYCSTQGKEKKNMHMHVHVQLKQENKDWMNIPH